MISKMNWQFPNQMLPCGTHHRDNLRKSILFSENESNQMSMQMLTVNAAH